MGFEPMSAAVKGQCVKPLHQRAVKENKRHFPCEGVEPSLKIFTELFIYLKWTAVSLLLNKHYGAGDENRTHAVSLEG